jgi:RNA polymerase sigma-70 factor (ECF subfamily)
MDETESVAVARARAGDGDAFRLLVERHSRSVFRLAYRMTANEQDAEDVVQETFLRAFRQIDKFDNRASFGTWIYRIAANYSLDLMRSRRKREDHREGEPDVLDTLPTAALPADRVVYSSQLREHVDAAMAGLSPQERTAFVLRHFEGQSIEEIGEALGIGLSATKNSIFRAVQKLRRTLEPLVGTL